MKSFAIRTKPLIQLRPQTIARNGKGIPIDDQTSSLVREVCRLAGNASLIKDVRKELRRQGVVRAIEQRDTPTLYNWMVRGMAFQGISDYVAHAYMEENGSVTWDEIEQSLADRPRCGKLRSYWAFHRCGYSKANLTCSRPENLGTCPLPGPTLRNGRLNQSAFSLYLFMRDVAGGDFVDWLGTTISSVCRETGDYPAAQNALLGRLHYLFGLSDKMLSMILSDLLIGASRGRGPWLQIGAGMIVVDTLVHNFLHRTGITKRQGRSHQYGPACYGADGCAHVLRRVAGAIDAREFSQAFPANFPRFVQHAIWRFCAQQELDTCNGNRIHDDDRCRNSWCPVFANCSRITLF